MRAKRDAESHEPTPAAEVGDPSRRERIRANLERRGVTSELSAMLALSIEEQVPEEGSAAYDSLLDGVALASGIESASSEELCRSLRDLRELERLMGSFVGELSKLDEALEVLAAYLRRMRANSARKERRLH